MDTPAYRCEFHDGAQGYYVYPPGKPRYWQNNPRPSADEALAAWHQNTNRTVKAPRGKEPAGTPQRDVKQVATPGVRTFKHRFPAGSGHELLCTSDEVCSFLAARCPWMRTPTNDEIPQKCPPADRKGVRMVNAACAALGVNSRPICTKWQLTGYQGCPLEFCETGPHSAARGCSTNAQNVHLCMHCCGCHPMLACPWLPAQQFCLAPEQ